MDPIPLQSGIAYGPVNSRRLGWSLGLNTLPTKHKLCSFNCVYCQYGWTDVCTIDITDRVNGFPAPNDFGRALESALQENDEINNITFSGNGEPTLHPQFEELVDVAKRLRDEYFPKARIGILSNSSTVGLENVFSALGKLDFRIMKLDFGTLETFSSINRPCTEISYETILTGLQSLENITLQTMFVNGKISNIGKHQINAWIKKVGKIKPMNLQIYSLYRPTADPSLHEVSGVELREIATQTEEATGVPVEVIVAVSHYRRRINRYWK